MPIPLFPFGRTGHQSTRILFGAAALSRVSQDVADRTLDVLLEHKINHIDVAASYGDAELRVAPWLNRHPGRFFLATTTGRRRADEAREELHRSLDRLGVDHVDLWQLHNLADPIEWDTASARAARWRPPCRLATRAWCASSASPATAPRSPPTTGAAWNASTSIQCSCPTTARPCGCPTTRRTSTPCSTPAGSARSRCRPSRPSPARRGWVASAPPPPGTSHSRSRPTSTRRSGAPWARRRSS